MRAAGALAVLISNFGLFTPAASQPTVNVSIVAGTPGGGCQTSGDGGAATAAQFDNPIAVCADAAGNLYVAEQNGHAVRYISYSNGSYGLILLFAGIEGSHGTGGDGGAATDAQLDSPYGLHCHGSGTLFIADTNNHAIRTVSSYATALGPSIMRISTWAGTLGHYGTIGDGL